MIATFQIWSPAEFVDNALKWQPDIDPVEIVPAPLSSTIEQHVGSKIYTYETAPLLAVMRYEFGGLELDDLESFLEFRTVVGGTRVRLYDTWRQRMNWGFCDAQLYGAGLTPAIRRQQPGWYSMTIELAILPALAPA